ncbi:MAG: TraR/DksA family transcriptional regulator [Thiobacillaceae bacterium]
MTHLTSDELKNIQGKLRDRQKALLEQVRDELDQRENQHLVEFMRDEPGDAGDISLADALSDMNIASVDRHIHELRDIEAAFGRIKDGSFGQCIDCGDDVDSQRLFAYPTAKRCIACQQKHEQVFVQEGHPSL